MKAVSFQHGLIIRWFCLNLILFHRFVSNLAFFCCEILWILKRFFNKPEVFHDEENPRKLAGNNYLIAFCLNYKTFLTIRNKDFIQFTGLNLWRSWQKNSREQKFPRREIQNIQTKKSILFKLPGLSTRRSCRNLKPHSHSWGSSVNEVGNKSSSYRNCWLRFHLEETCTVSFPLFWVIKLKR